MLTIEVEYLTGRVYASSHHDRQKVEWPPHPARLFSALVAALHEQGNEQAAREALIKLERSGVPQIIASDAAERTVKKVFVPINDPGLSSKPEALPENRTKQARFFPSATPTCPLVRFFWPEIDGSSFLPALAELCGCVSHVGHSSSLVRVSAHDKHPGMEATLIPDVSGDLRMRVQGPGQLEALEREYAIHQGIRLHRLPALTVPYRRVDENAPPPPAQGHFSKELMILKMDPHPTIGRPTIEAGLGLARTLRKAILEKYPGDIPESVSGHQPDGSPTRRPHVAFIFLPDVAHPYARSEIMGMGLALPEGLSDEARLGLAYAASAIPKLWTGAHSDGFLVRLVSDVRSKVSLIPGTWTRPATRWASVTPYVFDRHPKKGLWGTEAAATVADACKHSGLPEPAEIVLRPTSLHLGCPPVKRFPAHRRKSDNRGRPMAHIVIRFNAPVAGPVILGAARFLGYGLCRPVQEEVEGPPSS